MRVFGKTVTSKVLASCAAASLVVAPVVVMADAGSTSVERVHKVKHKAKKRVVRRTQRARPVVRQEAPAPVEVAQPVYQAPPEPVVAAAEPAPVPVAEAAPAPAPVAPAPAASGGGSGLLIGLAAAAAVVAGVVAFSGSSSP
jgi:hypothetical protein